MSMFEIVDSESVPPAVVGGYLDGLNERQREAVEAVDGPLLVLAGAGTGKTRVLTTRLVHILATGRARPWQVMAVTFTNKAAREMRERVGAMLGRPVEGWWVGTFHAIGARILRAHAEQAGLKPNFTIIDTDDQLRLCKQLMEARNLDTRRMPPRLLASVINRWKDRGLTPERVTKAEGSDAVDGHALPIYREYQERLTILNAADFGDLLLRGLSLFRDDPEVLKKYQQQFRYLLVDEYQDTNIAQYLWLRGLAQGSRNICCVGDDDQSIYSWRGAEVGNILRFEQDFPGAKVVRLELNYRSTPQILAAASALISHNEGRLGKTLWTPRSDGEAIEVQGVWDGEDEARTLCDTVESLQHRGLRLSDMAILVRAGFQTREFEERLVTVGIPYRVVGGLRFYERQEIRDAIAYFRLVVQPDDDLAFERVVNTPKRGLGPTTLRAIHVHARATETSLSMAAARLVEGDDLKPAARTSLSRFLSDLLRWRALLNTQTHPEVAKVILDESGYTEMWQQERSPDAQGRLENLKELVAALAEFESLGGFLEHVSLVMENDEGAGDEKITLMTMHAAKGLEFDIVFLPGWEEGIFPNQRALDTGGVSALEEERRLAYVALTRARKEVRISYAASRLVYGTWQTSFPSRFLNELPAEQVTHAAAVDVAVRGDFYPRRGDAMGGRTGGASFLGGTSRAGMEQASPRSPLRYGAIPPPQARHGRSSAPGLSDVDATPRANNTFVAGQRVFHQKFGYGEIRAVSGDTLDIEFEKAGAKTVVHSFVRAA